MRLICPNCGAQYEVPVDVIPETGRDVQCSNCGDTWFQPHPDHDIELAEELERALPDQEWQPDQPPSEPEPFAHDIDGNQDDTEHQEPMPEEKTATRRELDPAIADLLRQEAELETRAREAESVGLESQPDLGLEAPESEDERRNRESRTRMSRLRGQPAVAEPEPVVIETGPSTRRNVLPDIEEINSTLRSTGDRKSAPALRGKPATPTAHRRGRGFRLGFGLTLLIAAGAIIAYVNADQIVELVPEAKPYLAIFVEKVGAARLWLDTQMVDVMLWLDEKAAAAGGNTSEFGDLNPPETSDSTN